MATKVGINGFGRIGRLVLRAMVERGNKFQIMAINDLFDADMLAYMFKYDSTQGKFNGTVEVKGTSIVINGKEIPILGEKDPAKLPWGKMGVDVVLESTGKFTSKAAEGKAGYDTHLVAGAKRVLLSAPAKDKPDATIVLGVNDNKYDPANHHVISNASCTTNGLAPAVKVVNDNFKMVRGFMTTIHAYTNDQKILDMPHSDLRRARAAAMSIIPTSTGAARALKLVIPELAGKLDGYALRVPTSTVSVIDLTAEFEKAMTTEELRQAFRDAAAGPLKGILQAVEEPLVSIDFKGDPHSSSVDLAFTMVLGKEKSTFAKIVAWYDNEWGYAVRTADLAAMIAKKL